MTEKTQNSEMPIEKADLGFSSKEWRGIHWPYGVFFVACMAFATFGVYVRISEKIHLQGLTFHSLFQIVSLPLLCVLPLILSLTLLRYLRDALKNNHVSKSVADISTLLIELIIFFVYCAFAELAIWT